MIIESVVSLFGLGFVSASILSVASKLLAVEEDPRLEVIVEALPGANCGGCGFAGCEAYAAAVINDPSMAPNKCCAGGPDVAKRVAELTGKAAGDADPTVAFRRCAKVEGNVAKKFEYFGVMSCAAAKLVQDGPDACKYSCLGFGDCVRACPFDAMRITKDGRFYNKEQCMGCGLCVDACTQKALSLYADPTKLMPLDIDMAKTALGKN